MGLRPTACRPQVDTQMHTHTHHSAYVRTYTHAHVDSTQKFGMSIEDTNHSLHRQARTLNMGCLQLVGSLKCKVSFAKEPWERDDILQKKPIILRSLLIVATQYPRAGTPHAHHAQHHDRYEHGYEHSLSHTFRMSTKGGVSESRRTYE